MTPQERQLVDDLFDRLAKVESAPRDGDASQAIQDGLRKAPNAIYALVQTVLVQDEALKRAAARIQELEQAPAPEQTAPINNWTLGKPGSTSRKSSSAVTIISGRGRVKNCPRNTRKEAETADSNPNRWAHRSGERPDGG